MSFGSSFRWSSMVIGGAGILLGVVVAPATAFGQGCMPFRFMSPSLGGPKAAFLQPGEWQLGVAMRRIASDKFFLGTHEIPGPNGQPLDLRLNSLDLSFTYATSERLSMTLTVPLAYSTAENTNADLKRHQVSSSGVGDLNLMANLWLGLPARHLNGDVSVGLGVKTPTGRNHIKGTSYDSLGNPSQVFLQQTIQMGDGGWAVLVQSQGFQHLFGHASAYYSGFYSVSLRRNSDVPTAGTFWAIPDVYSARVGFADQLMMEPGLSTSLGWRIDGTPTNDLIGGHTAFFRHDGYTMYLDPGISFQSGPNQFALNVPVRIRQDYTGPAPGGVPDYALYASFTRTF